MLKWLQSNGFKIFMSCYSGLLILLVCFGLNYVWNYYCDYKAGLPDVNMERNMWMFDADNLDDTLDKHSFNVSEFENFQDVKKIYMNRFIEGTVTFERLEKVYTDTNPVYQIISGNTPLARVSFKEVDKNKNGFSVWEINDIDFYYEDMLNCSVTIKAPVEAVITVNGRALDEEYITSVVSVEMTANIGDYIENIPSYSVYTVTGLSRNPVVEAFGSNIALVNDENYSYSFEYGTDAKLLASVSEEVRNMSREYGAYLVDRGNLNILRSYTIGKAREYVSSVPGVNFYITDEDYSFTFIDEKIDNFVKYNDNCFSCDVSYTLSVTYNVSRNISYDTALRCMYVKVNDKWYLADFVIK